MKPDRIILVRHGESELNVDRSIQEVKPDYAGELSELGMKQALEAGRKIQKLIGDEPVYVYCSPYWRTRQTYLGIKQSIQIRKYYEDPRLREQEWSTELAPKDASVDKRRDKYGHFYYRIAGGESCTDVYNRVSDFMGTMFRDFLKPDYPKNVIIVNHGMTIRVFLMRLLHLTVEEFEILANPKNCDVIVLELNKKTCKYELQTDLRKYPSYNHPYQFDWVSMEEKVKSCCSTIGQKDKS